MIGGLGCYGAAGMGKNHKSYHLGVAAENDAAAVLAQDGYHVLGQRYKTPAGEIDLIVTKGGALGFVEVKRRRNYEDAAWSITERQQRRIAGAAAYWLQQAGDNRAFETITFDAVFVCPGLPPHHVIDAFRPQ